MSDLISRQAAIDAVCSVCGDTECNIFDPDNKAKLYCPEPYAIMKLPSAEPERKTGHWIEYYGDSKCSECGYILKIYDTNYCPNCGADMRGEQNG